MKLGASAQKDGGTESKGVKCQGISGNPVSSNHHYLALSHCMIQWNELILTKRRGKGRGRTAGKLAKVRT